MSRQPRKAVIITQFILLLIASTIFFTACQGKRPITSRPIIIKFGSETAGGDAQVYSTYTFTSTGNLGEVRIPQGPTVNQLDVYYEDGTTKTYPNLQDCLIDMTVINAQGSVGNIVVHGDVNPVRIKFGGQLRPDQQTCSGCTVKSISCSSCKDDMKEGKITSVTIWAPKP